jgi:hypothetical protein
LRLNREVRMKFVGIKVIPRGNISPGESLVPMPDKITANLTSKAYATLIAASRAILSFPRSVKEVKLV